MSLPSTRYTNTRDTRITQGTRYTLDARGTRSAIVFEALQRAAFGTLREALRQKVKTFINVKTLFSGAAREFTYYVLPCKGHPTLFHMMQYRNVDNNNSLFYGMELPGLMHGHVTVVSELVSKTTGETVVFDDHMSYHVTILYDPDADGYYRKRCSKYFMITKDLAVPLVPKYVESKSELCRGIVEVAAKTLAVEFAAYVLKMKIGMAESSKSSRTLAHTTTTNTVTTTTGTAATGTAAKRKASRKANANATQSTYTKRRLTAS